MIGTAKTGRPLTAHMTLESRDPAPTPAIEIEVRPHRSTGRWLTLALLLADCVSVGLAIARELPALAIAAPALHALSVFWSRREQRHLESDRNRWRRTSSLTDHRLGDLEQKLERANDTLRGQRRRSIVAETESDQLRGAVTDMLPWLAKLALERSSLLGAAHSTPRDSQRDASRPSTDVGSLRAWLRTPSAPTGPLSSVVADLSRSLGFSDGGSAVAEVGAEVCVPYREAWALLFFASRHLSPRGRSRENTTLRFGPLPGAVDLECSSVPASVEPHTPTAVTDVPFASVTEALEGNPGFDLWAAARLAERCGATLATTPTTLTVTFPPTATPAEPASIAPKSRGRSRRALSR